MPTASAATSNSNWRPEGPEFDKKVWKALLDIPFGTTTSYGAVAKRIGHPTAARAVGAANGANPIALIVPCHRVIGADGSLTGYGGGLPLKRKLLEHEARVCGTRLDLVWLTPYGHGPVDLPGQRTRTRHRAHRDGWRGSRPAMTS